MKRTIISKAALPRSFVFGQRGTVRIFENQELGRVLLEEIAGFGVYTPTHNFNPRTIIIDDNAILS